jgi:hypothetical protein
MAVLALLAVQSSVGTAHAITGWLGGSAFPHEACQVHFWHDKAAEITSARPGLVQDKPRNRKARSLSVDELGFLIRLHHSHGVDFMTAVMMR